ncbi:MAG: DUF6130 family protein [Acidobacteriota bacterium]
MLRTRKTPRSPANLQVIPLSANEPAPRIVVDAPLAEPLSRRGVAVIPHCANNMLRLRRCSDQVRWPSLHASATFT